MDRYFDQQRIIGIGECYQCIEKGIQTDPRTLSGFQVDETLTGINANYNNPCGINTTIYIYRHYYNITLSCIFTSPPTSCHVGFIGRQFSYNDDCLHFSCEGEF